MRGVEGGLKGGGGIHCFGLFLFFKFLKRLIVIKSLLRRRDHKQQNRQQQNRKQQHKQLLTVVVRWLIKMCVSNSNEMLIRVGIVKLKIMPCLVVNEISR